MLAARELEQEKRIVVSIMVVLQGLFLTLIHLAVLAAGVTNWLAF